ncbi:MAG TPA: alpha/beta hydrolase [Acidimicrobiales bacterium]|nr:alpha/beta hydrolase [Acidimicrobiales bacterium]
MPDEAHNTRTSTVHSEDGTTIAYHSLGRGPGLVLVGGVLCEGSDYMALASALTGTYEVHVVERRGRPGSGPQQQGHSIEDECADLAAVAAATNSAAVFGHSFGGLVALETARRRPIFDEVFVYEPGVPVRGQLRSHWFDDYERLLQQSDRRGAFAHMVKSAGFAPGPVAIMPAWYLRLVLRVVIRGEKWEKMDRLLEANLVEHRLQSGLDAPSPERFSSINARTVLLGGSKSPDSISGPLLHEIAAAIPSSEVAVLPGLGHLAPQDQPDQVAAAVLAHRGVS